jgi:hypothetical protein
MKRKVIQDFANVCCQMFITSLSNYDLKNLAILGSGVIYIDFLKTQCKHHGLAQYLLYSIAYNLRLG